MLETVLEHITDSVCGLDAKGQVLFANAATSYLLGWSSEEMRGVALRELAYRNRPAGVGVLSDQSPLSWLESEIAIYHIEETVWNQEGQPILVELTATPTTPDESLHVRMLVVMREVSDRQYNQEALLDAFRHLAEINLRLEETSMQLLQTEKMAAVGQLAAGMAHEINNPVGFILSNLNSLARYTEQLFGAFEQMAAPDAAAQWPEFHARLGAIKQELDYDYLQQDMTAILQESRDGLLRIKKIVQDLRGFAQEDAAQIPWGAVSIPASVEAALNLLNEPGRERIFCHWDPDLPEIHAQWSELNQLWMLLVQNAILAIDDVGEVHISAHLLNQEVRVEIADNGCGIAPEHLSRIFEPFFTTRAVGQGRGLGLTVARHIVDRHGGRIKVDSQPGRGSRFCVYLPIKQPAGGGA